MYVCIYACMYVSVIYYVYVCMYVCMYICMYAYTNVCMDRRMKARMSVCECVSYVSPQSGLFEREDAPDHHTIVCSQTINQNLCIYNE